MPISQPISQEIERRVLLVASQGRDAEVLAEVLAGADIPSKVCVDLVALCEEFERGAYAAVIAQECFDPEGQERLAEALAHQPDWSAFPLIVMASSIDEDGAKWRLLEQLNRSGQALFLDRPVRTKTLLSCVRSAILSRSRQFQMRAELRRRRKAEGELRISEKRFRLTFENAAVGIGHVDLDGHFLRVNDRFCEITGYSKARLESTTFEAITHPDDFADDWMRSRQLLAGKTEQYMIEKRYRRPDGSYVPVHLSVSLMRDETGLPEHFIAVVQDISDQKKAEEALVEVNRRKDEFLATLSHELRNPLAPISSGLELLRMIQDDPVQVDRILSTMERQTHQLTTLVDDLMDLSRIAKAKLEVRKTRVPLRDVIEIAVEAVQAILVHHQHEFHLCLPESDIYLNADPQRLAQVLINLLNNAAKYTPPGGHVELKAQLEGERVRLTVSDNGIGIPKEMQSQIFEMFSQLKHPLVRGLSGLGIGLTLVKSLVSMHGGEVEVFSEGEGRGAEFRVWLPVDASGSIVENRTVSPGKAELRVALRVLIIDDNRAAAEMLSMGLQGHGHDVRVAHDGLAGLDAAREFLPNVIFLDLGMPVLNGYETARRIRKEPWGAGVKLIALSGWGHDSDRLRTAEAGFDDHLVKPTSLEQIHKLLIQ